MDKKVIIGLIIAIILIIVAVAGYVVFTSNKVENKDEASNSNETKLNEEESNIQTSEQNGKTLVVYYSAQTHTKAVAEKIASNINADIFEIVPKQIYTSNDLDWTDNQSRVSKEHNNESLRNVELVTTKVENWESYDTILIGYPIWWRNSSLASR